MSLPSIVSYGAAAKTSSLVWDGDLVIPDGYAIESASGEVGIIGDVTVSGSFNSEGTITAESITSLTNLVGENAVLSGKKFVFGENVGNANTVLAQIPTDSPKNYTSPDFPISNSIDGVQYIVPSITFEMVIDNTSNTTFTIQAKLSDGSYQNLSSVTIYKSDGTYSASTQARITPVSATALRYTISASGSRGQSREITSALSLALTPVPVY